MTLVLGELLEECCIVYIDDILVFGKDVDEHDRNLKKVLERLNDFNLKENLEKRIKRVESLTFLGLDISLNEVKPSVDRAQGIMDYVIPVTRFGNL